MTARGGMLPLITELRALTYTGTADYTETSSGGPVSFFSDDQLQSLLDRTRLVTKIMPITPIPVRIGSLTEYIDYQIPTDQVGIWFEQYATDGTNSWFVKDGYGNARVINVDYSINYDAALVSFLTGDQHGAAYLLDCYSYGMYAAAAAVWREKAGFEWRSIAFKTDKHDINAEQRYQHCLERATYFESKSDVSGDGGIVVAKMYRTDSRLGKPNWSVKGGKGNILGTPLWDNLSGYRP